MIRKKYSKKKVVVIIIVILFLFSIISMFATKVIYDSIFLRKNISNKPVAEQLQPVVESRSIVNYPSEEGKMQGYLYEAADKKDVLIVLAPGFHAVADDYLWQISELLDYGWSVFAFDTIGSGASEGESSIGFSQEILDIQATLKYLEEQNRYGYEKLVLLGHSRGGYAACCMLAYDYDVAGVISVSGLNSAMDGIMSSSVDKIGNVAYGNYPYLWLYQSMIFGTEMVNQKASDAINESQVPVLIVQGKEDEVAPVNAYSIYAHREEIESTNVQYFVCDEPEFDGHTDLMYEADGTANDELMAEIHDFLCTALQ